MAPRDEQGVPGSATGRAARPGLETFEREDDETWGPLGTAVAALVPIAIGIVVLLDSVWQEVVGSTSRRRRGLRNLLVDIGQGRLALALFAFGALLLLWAVIRYRKENHRGTT